MERNGGEHKGLFAGQPAKRAPSPPAAPLKGAHLEAASLEVAGPDPVGSNTQRWPTALPGG